jgi:acetyltransferase-like isoleucine patch superfamily enzyme
MRYAITQYYWRARMRNVGSRSILYRPILVGNPGYISIGQGTLIRDLARLEVLAPLDGEAVPALTIGNNVNIEQGAHIICQTRVTIEDDVSITPYCVIADAVHPFDAPDMPPKIGARLDRVTPHPVHIGRGSFVGARSVILPGVTIGVGCVIGAGSVVARDIPDYCVAVGSPARVVRRFDPVARTWNSN